MREHWVMMPHPAHFICARDCRFFLATEVGGYIVSTVGEYLPDQFIRKIYAECRGVEIKGRGDDWDREWMQKMGYEKIGYDRLYETMVFKSKVSDEEESCCPFRIICGDNVDFQGYNDPIAAYKGHLELCEKWSNKNV